MLPAEQAERINGHSRTHTLGLRRNKTAQRDQKEPAVIHTTDTSSVLQTMSLTCQSAVANTGQPRAQTQTGSAHQRGWQCEKEPILFYLLACLPSRTKSRNSCMAFSDISNFFLCSTDSSRLSPGQDTEEMPFPPPQSQQRRVMLPHMGENL